MAIVLPKFSRRRAPTRLASETQPAVNLSLCRDDGVYEAGGTLGVKWRISRVPMDEVQGLEVSVMWHTEGKGDEDLHVHHFHRVVESQIRRAGLADEQSVQCVLPATPLSYHGRLITVQWCVRLRLFLSSGREIVAEQPFYLVSPNMISPCTLQEGRETMPKTIGSAADSEKAATLSQHRSARSNTIPVASHPADS